jgi:hypothetical protein
MLFAAHWGDQRGTMHSPSYTYFKNRVLAIPRTRRNIPFFRNLEPRSAMGAILPMVKNGANRLATTTRTAFAANAVFLQSEVPSFETKPRAGKYLFLAEISQLIAHQLNSVVLQKTRQIAIRTFKHLSSI